MKMVITHSLLWTDKRFVTGASRVISVHSTGPAQSSLTSEIGRDRVYSGWYERIMSTVIYVHTYTHSVENMMVREMSILRLISESNVFNHNLPWDWLSHWHLSSPCVLCHTMCDSLLRGTRIRWNIRMYFTNTKTKTLLPYFSDTEPLLRGTSPWETPVCWI